MAWFRRTKEGYLEDIEWISSTAKTFFTILQNTSDPDNLKTQIAQNIPNSKEDFMDPIGKALNWTVTRREGCSISLLAEREQRADSWNGFVDGSERYEGLNLAYHDHRDAIAVSAERASRFSLKLGSLAVRARDDLAKRQGFFDIDAIRQHIDDIGYR